MKGAAIKLYNNKVITIREGEIHAKAKRNAYQRIPPRPSSEGAIKQQNPSLIRRRNEKAATPAIRLLIIPLSCPNKSFLLLR
jgi:hypothetical protein